MLSLAKGLSSKFIFLRDGAVLTCIVAQNWNNAIKTSTVSQYSYAWKADSHEKLVR